AVAAAMLRRVHGLVGAPEELVELPLGAVRARKADGGGGAMLRPVGKHVLCFGDGATYALGSDSRAGLRRLSKRDDEFLTAPSRDEVALARDAREDTRDSLENRVPGVVAERVVDLLEVVDVEEEHAHRKELLVRRGARFLDPLDERSPIEEPRERVGR